MVHFTLAESALFVFGIVGSFLAISYIAGSIAEHHHQHKHSCNDN